MKLLQRVKCFLLGHNWYGVIKGRKLEDNSHDLWVENICDRCGAKK